MARSRGAGAGAALLRARKETSLLLVVVQSFLLLSDKRARLAP